MEEDEKQEKSTKLAELLKLKYMLDEEYKQHKLQASKDQRTNPKPKLGRKPKKVGGFTAGQFLKWNNETGKLKELGNLTKSSKEGLWCPWCGALYFAGETNDKGVYTACCQSGTFKNHLLMDETVPKELLPLYCPKTKKEKKLSAIFKANIIKLNNVFAMTSFGGTKKISWSTVKIHGKCFHRLDYLIPDNKKSAGFAQLYFLNDGDQLEQRLARWKNQLKRAKEKANEDQQRKLEKKIKRFENQLTEIKEIVVTLQNVLNEQNKFVKRYKTAQECMEKQQYQNLKIVFKCNERPRGSHARLYNKPIEDEIGVLVPDTDKTKYKHRCVVMYLKDCPERFKKKKNKDGEEIEEEDDSKKKYQSINEFNKQYDPLHYVLLFPAGQMSWGFYMPRETQVHPDKKYFPPVPGYDHRTDSDDTLEELCNAYDLFTAGPRACKIKLLTKYDKYKQKVTFF